MNLHPYALVSFFAFVINFFLLLFVFFRNPRQRTNALFSLWVLSIVGWLINEFLMRSSDDPEQAALFARLIYVSVSFLPGLYLVFAVSLPQTRIRFLQRRPSASYCFLIPGVVFLYFNLATDSLVKGVDHFLGTYHVAYGPVYRVFVLYFIGFLALGAAVFYLSYRRSRSRITREQLRYNMVASVIPIIGGSFTDVVLPALGVQTVRWASAFTIFMAAIIAYSVMKYQSFAIRQYLRKGLSYGAAALILILAFIAIESTVSLVFPGANPSVAVAGPIVVLIVLVDPVRRGVARAMERFSDGRSIETWKTEEIFLIHVSGRVIAHLACAPVSKKDAEVVAGMLTAIEGFVKETFSPDRKEALNIIKMGETKMLIEHSPHVYIVVVFRGYESEEMQEYVRRTLRRIHQKYRAVLSGWDGRRSEVSSVVAEVERLLPVLKRPVAAAQR